MVEHLKKKKEHTKTEYLIIQCLCPRYSPLIEPLIQQLTASVLSRVCKTRTQSVMYNNNT